MNSPSSPDGKKPAEDADTSANSAPGCASSAFLKKQGCVWETLGSSTGPMPHVALRDAEAEPSPLVRPIAPEPPVMEGSTGRFHILGELGRGGVGRVLKGHDLDLNRDVALKVLREDNEGNPEMMKRFVEEAQIGGQLQHPGVVPVYQLGVFAERRPYFAMKLVKGRTLAEHLKSRKDESEDRRRFLGIFEQICQTVAYAHARGVIHRDLKPSNVMVGAFGEVQVMDWGLAKVLSARRSAEEEASTAGSATVIHTVRSETPGSESQMGLAMGTPAYMSPEQAQGRVESLDERSDVFGLGAILCEILTGRPPYLGERIDEVCRKASKGEVSEAIGRLRSSRIERKLLRIVEWCLKPEPSERPRDAGVVAAEVARYLATVEERARASELEATEARVRAQEERKARRLTAALAGSVLLIMVIGGAAYLWIQSVRAQVESDRRIRIAETTSAVSAALAEATLSWGQAKASQAGDFSKWSEAVAAAKRAEALAAAGDVEPATIEQVEALLRDLEEGEASARLHSERALRDRRMVARLEEIRTPRGEVFGKMDRDLDYQPAFREYGIDLRTLGLEEAAERIRSSAIAAQLVAALDDWALGRGVPDEGPSELQKKAFTVADAADPEPLRHRLREAAAAKDLAGLRELAASREVESWPAWTLDLLGLGLLLAKDPEGAENHYRRSHRRYPGDFWINCQLGLILGAREPPLHEESLRFLTASLAMRPESLRMHFLVALAIERTGALEEAVLLMQQCTRRDSGSPDAAEAQGFLGLLLVRKREFDGACEAFREAIRLKPNDAFFHNALGVALLFWGDVSSAVAAIRDSIRLDPDYADAHRNLGVALAHIGEGAAAIEATEEALRLAPDDAMAKGNLGRFLVRKGDFERAATVLKEAVQLEAKAAPSASSAPWVRGLSFGISSSSPETRCDLGFALARKGDLDAALEVLKEARLLNPQSATAHKYLGLVLYLKDENAGSIVEFREAIRLKPDDVEAHCGLSAALLKEGQIDAAVEESRIATRLAPTDAEARKSLGTALYGKKDVDGAIQAYREAIALRSDDPETWHGLGATLYGKGDFAAAIDALKTSIRLKPDDAEAQKALGLASMQKGDTEGAVRALKESIRLDPRDPEAQCALGGALFQQRDFDGAAAALREAVRLKPDFPEARSGLGAVLVEKGDVDEAVPLLEEATRLSPADPVAWRNLGVALHRKEDAAGAIQALSEATRLDPKSTQAWKYLGKVLLDRKSPREDLPKAIDSLRKAAELRPDDGEAHRLLGLALARDGNPEGAIEELTEAVRLSPDDAEAWKTLGFVLYDRKELGLAIVAFRQLVRLKPKEAEAHKQLGAALAESENFEEAAGAFRRVLQLTPEDAEAHRMLGSALAEKGEVEDAERALREALRLNPNDGAAHGILGILLARRGNVENAVVEFREAVRLMPEDAKALGDLGATLAIKGDFKEAVGVLKEALRLRPDDAKSAEILGKALVAAGQTDEAIRFLREWTRQNPGYARAWGAYGAALFQERDIDGALDALKEAVRLDPEEPDAQANLALLLRLKGDLQGAVRAFRTAIRLRPDDAEQHFQLGGTLFVLRDLEGACAALKEAVRLGPDRADARGSLGAVLAEIGDFDVASDALKEALRLKPLEAQHHWNLGLVLKARGLYADAISEFRRAEQLAPEADRSARPSEIHIRQCERMMELESQLPAVIRGEIRPETVEEVLSLAQLCATKKLYAAAAGFWRSAFLEKPDLSQFLRQRRRYRAACAAAIAGCGEGEDASTQDDQARAEWRAQSLRWLKADRSVIKEMLQEADPMRRETLRDFLRAWRSEPTLRGLREEAGLNRLPAVEREAWRAFWLEVDAILETTAPEADAAPG